MKSETIERVALVGVGGFGRTWVRLFSKEKDYQVVGIVDAVPQHLKDAAAALGLRDDQTYADLKRALEETKPDLVVDTTPPRFRLEIARQVFEHGAHLIVAKPLAETLDDARAMIRLAERAGKRLAVNQQQRYHPISRVMAEQVAEGAVGDVVCSYFTFFERRNWNDRLVSVPSPLYVESSIHHFDMFRAALGGTITRVNAVGWTPPDLSTRGKTAGAAWLQMSGGSLVVYQASRSSRNDLDPAYGTGWQGPWLIEGTKGVLRGDDVNGVFLNGKQILDLQAIEADFAVAGSDQRFFRDFVQALEEGRPFALDGKENFNTLAATHAAEISLEEGRWVDVEA